MKKTIEEIAAADGRYGSKALKFIYEGLGQTIHKIRAADDEAGLRHISGAELSRGLAEIAIERWGRLSKVVLNHWHIETTRDFGEIVYLMINNHWMTAQDSDSIEDFEDIFDFEEVLEKQFRIDV